MTHIETKVVILDSDHPERVAFEKAAQARAGWTATPPWDPGSGALHFERPAVGPARPLTLPQRVTLPIRTTPGRSRWGALAAAVLGWLAIVAVLAGLVSR